jgi:hypothetical protein
MTKRGSFRRGFDARRGHGLPGRSGRKSNGFKKLCARLLSDPRAMRAIAKIARDPRNPGACIQAQKFLASYALGLPHQSLELSARPISLEQILAQSWKKRDRVADAEEADVTAIDGKPVRRIATNR